MTHEERMELTYLRFPKMRPKDWQPKEEKKEKKISEIWQTGKEKIIPPFYETKDINISISDNLPPEPDIHGDICPNCGQKTLVHESGCVKCTSCAWSACG